MKTAQQCSNRAWANWSRCFLQPHENLSPIWYKHFGQLHGYVALLILLASHSYRICACFETGYDCYRQWSRDKFLSNNREVFTAIFGDSATNLTLHKTGHRFSKLERLIFKNRFIPESIHSMLPDLTLERREVQYLPLNRCFEKSNPEKFILIF